MQLRTSIASGVVAIEGRGVAESRYDKLIVRSQTRENDFFDFDTELEHLQILDSELVTELNILAFVQMRE